MNKLSDLAALMELKYQAGQMELRAVCAQETKIRNQILRLDQQSEALHSADTSMMKSVGADMLWKVWAGRTKSDLNTELAQVLARKEFFLRAARHDFGKVLVSQSLSENEQRTTRQATKANELDRILENLKMGNSQDDQ
ncbi:MAG: hypothetical protein ABJ370_21760 [Paracoccaceae bacterium]